MKSGVEPQGRLDPQSGYQQRGLELDIPLLQAKIPLQIRGVQFESTFSKSMMTQPAFIDEPSTQPLYTEPTYTKIPQPQVPSTPNHAP